MERQRRRFATGSAVVVALLALAGLAAAFKRATGDPAGQGGQPMSAVKIMTLDPGHFHAALVQKEMYPGVAPRVDIYAPLGFDLTEHLNRIARFNLRPESPTRWELEVHAGPDPLGRMLRERPGNVVVLSGRNQGKIDRIKAAVEAGLSVLADKPWVITAGDLPQLASALDTADARGLIAYDIMTERSEITTVLQKDLIHDPAVFGAIAPGTREEPGVYFESVHHLLKVVAGVPNLRPAWFFDVAQQGEGVGDVGTHLADLAQWMLFPGQAIDYRKEIDVVAAKRWPTVMTQAQFQRVTNEKSFPAFLAPNVRGDKLDYYCNGSVSYTLRGVHAKLDVIWNYEAPAGAGDTHVAVFRGTRSRVEVRQGKDENYRPELYVVPNGAAEKAAVLAALKARVSSLAGRYPGVAVEDLGARLRVTVPDRYRDGHEAHFAEVMRRFLGYLRDPKSLPAWEKPNMLAKYYVTTRGVELSHRKEGNTD
jgi:predicted dehydrogenase